MIGQIKGELLEVDALHILVDVQGVGYAIEVPSTTAYLLPSIGSQVVLHTHFVVREDAQLLYGFLSKNDRSLFRLLIKINGVGPKLAIAILSGLSADDLIHCIHFNDIATLVKLPGIGKKTAERLVIEMRDKIKNWIVETKDTDKVENQTIITLAGQDHHLLDAEAALEALGYKSQAVANVVKKVYQEGQTTQEIIRLALQNMVS